MTVKDDTNGQAENTTNSPVAQLLQHFSASATEQED